MTLQFDSAVVALKQGAKARDAGDLVQKRLSDVQTFLASDLARVESALLEVAGMGPAPATDAAKHLIDRGGKRVRPIALLLSAQCFGRTDEPRFSEMAAVVELAHSATLLHDDVVDEGMERRGAPTSRRLYGNGVSVLSGDLLLVNALGRTQAVAPELLADLIGTLRRLVEGEVIQLRGRTELDVSEATYERVLRDKTASLFSFAARAGALMAGASLAHAEALGNFGENLGIAFQLVDDVIDYDGEESGKTLFADLLEGKLTLPLVLAIQKDPSLETLVSRIHSGDPEPVAEVSRRVIESGSCDEVRARARDYTDRAISSLSGVPRSPSRMLLEVVAREMTRRSH
jgi:octaprenyl-diphosphate synthase